MTESEPDLATRRARWQEWLRAETRILHGVVVTTVVLGAILAWGLYAAVGCNPGTALGIALGSLPLLSLVVTVIFDWAWGTPRPDWPPAQPDLHAPPEPRGRLGHLEAAMTNHRAESNEAARRLARRRLRAMQGRWPRRRSPPPPSSPTR